MKLLASVVVVACSVLGLGCAQPTPRVAIATTPVHGTPTPPSDCGAIAAPHLAELCAMGETSLSVSGPETYRLVWMRHLHNPIAVRLTRSGTGVAVVTIESNIKDPRDTRRHEFVAGIDAWNKLRGHLESADFWNLIGDPTEDERGLDGADWVIEGRRGGIYHSVVRWSPAEGPFRSACADFVEVSGLSFPAEMR